MSVRFDAVNKAYNRPPIDVKRPADKISDYYASNVFTTDVMQHYLSKEAYKSVLNSIKNGTKIERDIADQVASGMKAWALSKGATHHTHWFQPLTGLTAEKHDTFFVPTDSCKGIEKFSGSALVQGEPDGSSFPSGGLRATHEARGYTAWDPSSPAFVMEVGSSGRTLCIPTIFISYSGESMDFKTPLLKSQQFLQQAAVPVCNYFDRTVTQVTPTLGWEQEFFLVDEAMYYARPDLVIAGRTLVGHGPAKGQQLDDHYFGSIPERVYAYMLEIETEALKLGIPISTRHNEVAPGQYEFAPVFTNVNHAVDQNQLLMDLMQKVAIRHHLRVLLHEKPFAGLNGSGKHNNWSMATDTDVNLLSPGQTPRKNLQFLTFFVNTIKAINENADLLRSSIASANNDHRLGANEAPPAIISVFIGSTLTNVLKDIAKKVTGKMDEYEQKDLTLDIHNQIPYVLLDNTDRNRTSPFAFTGNKFEFRAVGSSANCALPMTIVNTIVADQLVKFRKEVDGLVKDKKEAKTAAILKVLKDYINDSQTILFEGDNYSEAWEKEAKKRGLSNVKTSDHALDFFATPAAKKVLVGNGILSEHELEARHEVWLEQYTMKLQIEARLLGQIVSSQILPATFKYVQSLTNSMKGMKEVGIKPKNYKAQKDLVEYICEHTTQLNDLVVKMINARKKANKITDEGKKAKAYGKDIKPYFDQIRLHVDKLELVVDDELWPLPKYRELLFIR